MYWAMRAIGGRVLALIANERQRFAQKKEALQSALRAECRAFRYNIWTPQRCGGVDSVRKSSSWLLIPYVNPSIGRRCTGWSTRSERYLGTTMP